MGSFFILQFLGFDSCECTHECGFVVVVVGGGGGGGFVLFLKTGFFCVVLAALELTM